jgi:hypothetical protein
LTEDIAFLLTHPEQAAQLGRAGRGREQELFSWQQCVASYEALYNKLAIPPHDFRIRIVANFPLRKTGVKFGLLNLSPVITFWLNSRRRGIAATQNAVLQKLGRYWIIAVLSSRTCTAKVSSF